MQAGVQGRQAADAGSPTVSIIIPHLNQLDSLARCLVSISRQAYPPERAEVIVVDNGSKVRLDPVKAAWPGVDFLQELRPGPGLARNAGVAHARGDILLFIDADCRAGEGWIRAAVDALLRRPGVGIVGGDVRIDLVDARRPTALEAYESVFAYQQKMYIEKRHFSGTGNLGMWRDVHAAVGPFVGIAFAEDYEWGRRARDRGYAIDYVPDMVIYHPARQTFDQLAAKWRRHVAHDWSEHQALGRSRLRWSAHAGAMIGSIPVHAARLLTSRRLSGFANRLRGVGTLARIRAFRTREMMRVAAGGDVAGATGWNRGA